MTPLMSWLFLAALFLLFIVAFAVMCALGDRYTDLSKLHDDERGGR